VNLIEAHCQSNLALSLTRSRRRPAAGRAWRDGRWCIVVFRLWWL